MSRLGRPNLVPSNRAVAKQRGETRYVGKVCEMHPELLGERITSQGRCVKCHRQSVVERQKPGGSQHLRVRAYLKRYYTKNQERLSARQKEYAEKNPAYKARGLDRLRAWNVANSDKRAERDRKWREQNPDKHCAKESRRRAAKLSATPQWADERAILGFYETAAGLNLLTGEWHHVDHIVPLQSKTVCGLHVAANLQIIARRENASKGNRHWPGMP